MNDIKRIASKVLEEAGLHELRIKDKKYTIELLPATQAFAIATQLLKVCLPALGAYADGAQRKGLVLPEDDNVFTDIAVHLVSQVDKISVLDIVDALTKNKVLYDGSPIKVDEEFKGDLGGLLTLIEFCLKENCGSLFMDYLENKGIAVPSLQTLVQSKEETISSSEKQ